MPHIQILNAPAASEIARCLEPFTVSNPPEILKLLDVYASASTQRVLVEVVVVEGHLRQNFFLLLREEEGVFLMRCHPMLPVQKTDGVKRVIIEVARRILQAAPQARLGNTNLSALLPPDFPGTSPPRA